MRAISFADHRDRARHRLPNILYEYIVGGSYAEVSLARNAVDLEAIVFRQRVMRDMSKLDMRVQSLGHSFAMPLGLAPVGLAGMFRRRGEVQGARAAAAAGVPFCLSNVGVCTIEEVARTGVAPWFQLYMLRDRGYLRALLEGAKAAGCGVLMLTVDLPIPGARYRDVRSGFTGTGGFAGALKTGWDGVSHPAWMWDVWANGRPHTLGSLSNVIPHGRKMTDYVAWMGKNFDRSVTWADLDFVRKFWDGPIVVKGVLDPADARDAVSAGVQGLVVSNHGGRQLDGVSSSIAALPAVVDAVGSDIEVYMDGGIRSGLDVLKAVALGARACFIGRAWAFALAAGGQAGVSAMLSTFKAELAVAMVLTGCASVRDASRALLDARSWGSGRGV